jgi:rare lipoprotein A
VTTDTKYGGPGSGRRRAALAAFCAIAAVALVSCSGHEARRASQMQPYQQQAVAKRPAAHPHYPSARSAPAHYDIVGVASWYGRPYHGRRTASGQVYNMHQMTAAHPTLPFGTRVVVTNLENGRRAMVTINDRGPFVGGRIIDVSRKAASQLGFLNKGLTRVGVRVLASSQG